MVGSSHAPKNWTRLEATISDKFTNLLCLSFNYGCIMILKYSPRELYHTIFSHRTVLNCRMLQCLSQSLSTLYYICRLGWSLLKWSHFWGLHSIGRQQALATNIRVSVTKAVAYCATVLIILVKRSQSTVPKATYNTQLLILLYSIVVSQSVCHGHFYPNLIFVGIARAYQSGVHSDGRLQPCSQKLDQVGGYYQ